MKTSEFIQTVNVASYLTSRNLKLSDIVLQIDVLRKLHVRLQNDLQYLLLAPDSVYDDENEKMKIRNCAEEIKQFANENNIQVNFIKLPKTQIEFSKQFRDEKKFVSYYYKHHDVTNLIVFIEKKKIKYRNKKIEAIATLNLENDFVVLDKNGVNINKIDGVDL